MENKNTDKKNNQIANKEIIGMLIRQKRIAKGLTIDELAEKSEITPGFMSGIERGNNMPSLANLIRIANALAVGVDSLLGDNLLLNKCLMNDTTTNAKTLIDTCNDNEIEFLIGILKLHKQY